MIRLARTVDDWLPWIYIVIIIACTTILSLEFVWIQHQNNKIKAVNQQHTALIHRIQEARLESCEATYRSIGEIFDPFLKDRPRDPNVIKFRRLIHSKIRHCPAQVDVNHGGGERH